MERWTIKLFEFVITIYLLYVYRVRSIELIVLTTEEKLTEDPIQYSFVKKAKHKKEMLSSSKINEISKLKFYVINRLKWAIKLKYYISSLNMDWTVYRE